VNKLCIKSNQLHKKNPRAFSFVCSVFGIQSVKAECWEEAAAMYGHDPYLLKAIGWKESRGHVGAVGSLLKDGNRALGLMQINTIHLPRLNKLGIHRSDLFDPCTSQKVGAWVLADCLKKKGDIWVAVGCYYGGPASRAYTAMRGYATDVRRYYEGYKRQAGLPVVYQPLIGIKHNRNYLTQWPIMKISRSLHIKINRKHRFLIRELFNSKR
jgi:soluble lytic murein transglycosylase-like protein